MRQPGYPPSAFASENKNNRVKKWGAEGRIGLGHAEGEHGGRTCNERWHLEGERNKDMSPGWPKASERTEWRHGGSV